MPFIGNQPALSFTSFAKQDFTTSATTSYTLDNPVANANELALFINFVRQEPTTAYSANSTTLTLTEATSVGDDMYCVYLGKAVQTVNPPNASVGTAQLVNDSVTKDKVSNLMYPAFFAHSASDQTGLSDNTYTKVTLGTEVYDTDSVFADSRFTVPSGKAGKYFLYGSIKCKTASNSDLANAYTAIYLNGSRYLENRMNFNSNPVRLSTNLIHVTLDLTAGDYVELYGAVDSASSVRDFGESDKATNFGAYRIGD